MPIKFDIVDNRVLVRASELLIKELRAIWDADKTKLKEEASAHLAFISLYCDLESNFAGLDYREKEKLVKGNVYHDSNYRHSDKWMPLINEGIKAFMRYNQTSERRLLPVYDKKIDQIRIALEDIDMRVTDGYIPDPEDPESMIKVKANAKDIIDIMTELDKVIATKEKIEARINKRPDSKNRGDVESSLLEEGLLGIQPLTNAN